MRKDEILSLINDTAQDDDAGFQKIIATVLDGKFLTVKDLAHRLGASFPAIRRWSEGKSSPHPIMRKHIFKAIKDLLDKSA